MTMVTDNKNKANQALLDRVNVANKPIRAECAVVNIKINIGDATTNPIKHARLLIFATMICICFDINESVAPT